MVDFALGYTIVLLFCRFDAATARSALEKFNGDEMQARLEVSQKCGAILLLIMFLCFDLSLILHLQAMDFLLSNA